MVKTVKFRLGVLSSSTALGFQVLTFQVIVVELSIKVLMIINPCANHVWVLFIEICWSWCSVKGNLLIVAEVIGIESLIAPQYHLSPKIGVLTTFVHSCIRFEVLFDVEFILFKSEFNILGICFCSENPVEVSSHTILLIVESVKVSSSNSVDVLCQ